MENWNTAFAAEAINSNDVTASARKSAEHLNEAVDAFLVGTSEDDKVKALYFMAKFIDEMANHLVFMELLGESPVLYVEQVVGSISLAGLLRLAAVDAAEKAAQEVSGETPAES